MNRPDLEAIQKRTIDGDIGRHSAIEDRRVLLAYIAELENLVNSMGDEWEDTLGFGDPPKSLVAAKPVRILRKKTDLAAKFPPSPMVDKIDWNDPRDFNIRAKHRR